MRVNGREWPPDDPLTPTPRPRKSPPESWFVIFLLPGAPLIAWILAMTVPSDDRKWALLAWPIGWLIALIVTLISVYAHEQEDTK